MKLAQCSALLCLIVASVPLAVACGSTDSLGLFSTAAGGAQTSVGGASSQGGASAQAGHGAGGNISTTGGSSGSNASGAGQGTAGGNTGGKGAAGSGAAGNGGSGGSGGASAGNGGANAGSGGSNAGSGGSVAGTGGSAGSAGMSGCTPNVPVAGAACVTPTPNGCFYPGVDCDCMPRNGGGAFRGTWVCIGSGTPLCPQDLPLTGGACAGRNGAQCPYSSTDVCTCALDMTLKWDCSADKNFNCPTQAPIAGTNCTIEAMCQYLDDDCLCNGTRWVCQS